MNDEYEILPVPAEWGAVGFARLKLQSPYSVLSQKGLLQKESIYFIMCILLAVLLWVFFTNFCVAWLNLSPPPFQKMY